jgi:hypothetical protein
MIFTKYPKVIRPGSGFLPLEAQEWMRQSLKEGPPGSLARMRAIDRVYRMIEEKYPEYLKQKERK